MPFNKFSNKQILKAITAGLALLLMYATSGQAEVKLELEETEITGARELPKVLYIIPWKKTTPDSRPLPMRSLIDDTLAPIEMDVFRRQVRYYEMTQSPQHVPAE